MSTDIYIHIYTYIHGHIYRYICTYIHMVHLYLCVYLCILKAIDSHEFQYYWFILVSCYYICKLPFLTIRNIIPTIINTLSAICFLFVIFILCSSVPLFLPSFGLSEHFIVFYFDFSDDFLAI